MDTTAVTFSDSLDHAALSDIGMRRANNQDSYAVVLAEDQQSWSGRGHFFMVADGMGAHAAGELASKLAVDGVPHLFNHYRDLPIPAALERAIVETNSEIHRRGLANPDFHAMGTTASSLILSPLGAVVGHVGDSRVYRMRGDQLEQLTFDHSLQWELRSIGRIPEDSDLSRAVPKNVITRSLGPNANVVVDLEGPFPLEVGDTFLLCSDGLTGPVQDLEIAEILHSLPPKMASTALVDLANLRGGPDNITVIVARVVDSGIVTGTNSSSGSMSQERRAIPANVSACGIVAGICLLLGVILGLAGQPAPAVVSVLAGTVSAVWAWVAYFRGARTNDTSSVTGKPLGNGPHVCIERPGGAEFVETLASILKQLHEAAIESDWSIDWGRYRDFEDAATAAVSSQQYTDAVRHYCQAISFMMAELRRQRKRNASDSSIDY